MNFNVERNGYHDIFITENKNLIKKNIKFVIRLMPV